ncbi:MAG: alpha/beta hydrolase [Bacteroidota bacterium]
MLRPFLYTFSLLYLFISIPSFVFSQSIGEITWTDSFLNEEDQVYSDRLKFGYLTVPEDYKKPEGRQLQIAFIVIKASVNNANKDACMYFMGGWGSRTLKNLTYYQHHFLSYQRDLILYDYRGTGYSEPKLCSDLGEHVFQNLLANISFPEFEERQQEIFDDCLNSLVQQGVDFNQYGSNNKGKDGVLLAQALGYESYNLFGVSYGTKTILQFIRQSTVNIRSVVLDSNCPLDFPINAGMTEDYAKSLNSILAACANDPTCSRKYPTLKERLLSFLASLDQKPLKIKLPKSRVAYLNRQEMNGVIHQLLYNEQGYGMLPFLLKKISQRKKFILKRIIWDLEDVLKENYNAAGLINYVYDHKAFQQKAVSISQKSIEQYPVLQVFDGYQRYYLEDNRFLLDSLSTQMIQTDIPALILAGAYDPVTPVYYSKRLLPYFSKHFYVEFPQTGHGVTDNPCGDHIAENFLNDLEDPYDNPCMQKIQTQQIVFDR